MNRSHPPRPDLTQMAHAPRPLARLLCWLAVAWLMALGTPPTLAQGRPASSDAAPTAAADNQDVTKIVPIHEMDACCNFGRCFLALDLDRIESDLNRRITPTGNFDDIADGRTIGTCHNADDAW